ncbi:MAG: M18 family aminopeptidase [Turicibacter sp.]|nr:M18 family aminopeptidase [Turicibacter sp.]
MSKQMAQALIDFMHESPSTFHHVLKIQEQLEQNGYQELKDQDKWQIQPQGKYFVKKHDSSLIAFEIGSGDITEHGMRLLGAHTDSPSFKIKSKSEMVTDGTYLRLNTEMYGGALAYTWFDRPLSVAGKITVRSSDPFKPETHLVNIDRPIMTIPSVAIHLKRDSNEKFGVNKQKDTLPLLGLINRQMEKNGYLVKLIAAEANVPVEDILGFDLALYEHTKGCLVGMDDELISTKGLDDKWMTYAGLLGLLQSQPLQATKVLICMDNEEIGSLTSQGADSLFILNVLERVLIALGKNREELHQAMSHSIMISADLAHAVHPNSPELHDPTNRPLLGKGPVLKAAASGSYSTDAYGMAVFKGICEENNIPYQQLYNRSDVRGGTTIGPITAAMLTIPVIDMGAPLLGMHSIRELAAVDDHAHTVVLFTKFFS